MPFEVKVERIELPWVFDSRWQLKRPASDREGELAFCRVR